MSGQADDKRSQLMFNSTVSRRKVVTRTLPAGVSIAAAGSAALGRGQVASAPLTSRTTRQPVTLQFWGRQPENVHISAVVQEWNETHPDVQVEYQGLPPDQYRTKILTAMAAGNAPDVIGMGVGIMPQYMEQGTLLALDDFIEAEPSGFRDDFAEGLWVSATHEGTTYAIPFWSDPSALYYNVDLFNEAGITEAPETWDDLMAAAEATSNVSGNPSSDVYGAIFPAIGPWVMFVWLPFVWGNGGSLLEDSNCAAFQNEAGTEAMQLWVDLFQEGYMPRSAVLGSGSDELVSLVLSNRAAMYIQGPNLVQFAAENAPDINLGTALMPRPVDGTHSSYLGGDNLVITRDSDHPEEAWEFIKFMMDAERMRDLTLGNNGIWIEGLMTRESAFTDAFFEEYPLLRPFAEAQEVGRTPAIPLLSEVRVPIWNNFQEAMLGNKSVEDAMADAQAEVNEITGCSQ